MLDFMLGSGLAWVIFVIVMVLLLTPLVTTVDPAILIVNTFNAGAAENHPVAHKSSSGVWLCRWLWVVC
ncbi:MAG: hypothetical protein WBG95_10455 [Sulfitobacter sp.]